jgi:hypothetical protein
MQARYILVGCMILMNCHKAINAASYQVVNNGGNKIGITLMFAAPAVCHDQDVEIAPGGSVWVNAPYGCCLRGVGLSWGGSIEGTSNNWVPLSGCSDIDYNVRTNVVEFNQHINGKWSVSTGRS